MQRITACARWALLCVGTACSDGSPLGPSSFNDALLVDAGSADGAPDASLSSDAGQVFSTSTVCTSGATWSKGNDGNPKMNPGQACITCHSAPPPGSDAMAPHFSIAGTLYPTLHEPDSCNGVNATISAPPVVEITDATGKIVLLTPNEVGNFYLEDAVSFPIHARVLYQDREWEMLGPQMSGDCNSCHTEKGLGGAPGRILLP